MERQHRKIKDQIKELDMLRQEGADTNMCTFSQLKRYPFFYEPSHWFCIFGPEIPEIYEMYADTQNNYASFINTLENATDMCNSDKFSLCLTFKTMPSLPVDALNSGLSAQNQILKEQEGTESEKTYDEWKADISFRICTVSASYGVLKTTR